MIELTTREYIALQILNGACSADWKFDIPEGMKWDTLAVLRSFELADEFLKFINGEIKIPPKKKAKKNESQ